MAVGHNTVPQQYNTSTIKAGILKTGMPIIHLLLHMPKICRAEGAPTAASHGDTASVAQRLKCYRTPHPAAHLASERKLLRAAPPRVRAGSNTPPRAASRRVFVPPPGLQGDMNVGPHHGLCQYQYSEGARRAETRCHASSMTGVNVGHTSLAPPRPRACVRAACYISKLSKIL